MQLILSGEQLKAFDVVTLRALCRGVRKATAGAKRELITRLCSQPVAEQQPAGQTAVHSLGSSTLTGSKRRRSDGDDQARHMSSSRSHTQARMEVIQPQALTLLSQFSTSTSSSLSSLQPVRDRPGLLFLMDAPPQRVTHGAAVELGGSQWHASIESDCLVLRTASRTDDKKERTACRIANIKHEVTTCNERCVICYVGSNGEKDVLNMCV